MSQQKILIIGGGISGLSTARWLADSGVPVELWEADQRLGGKIRSHRESGYLTENAAGILMNYRAEVDQQINAAGLSEQKCSRGSDMRRYVVQGGRLCEVPMQVPALLASPLWSWRGKLRMASELLVARGGDEQETVSQFIRRRFGSEILEKVMDPYVAGTLASDPEQTNAASVLPRMTALERRYGSITAGMLINRLLHRRRANRAEAFSFQGGIGKLVEQLANHPLIKRLSGTRATTLQLSGTGWQVGATDRSGAQLSRQVDQLVLATPADATAGLLDGQDARLARLLDAIEYAPLSVLHLGLARKQISHPLDGSGFLTPRREGLSFNGNLWMSSLFAGRAPSGQVLLTSYIGGARHPERSNWNEAQALTYTLADLRRLIGLRGEPDYLRLVHHPRALPLYHGDYLQRSRQIRARVEALPGLHLVGNYLDGVSVRDRIVQGSVTAQQILHSSRSESGAQAFSYRPATVG